MSTQQLKGNIDECVKFVADRFEYKADKLKFFDFWKVMKLDSDGKFRGDCEDFSLTVFWYYYGCSLFSFLLNVLILHRSFIWHVRANPDGGHAVGYTNGKYFDNWTKKTVSSKQEMTELTGHKFLFPVIYPLNMIYMVIGFIFK